MNAANFHLKTSVTKEEAPRHCLQNRVAKGEGSMLPVRFGTLYDVREGSEVRVSILDQRI